MTVNNDTPNNPVTHDPTLRYSKLDMLEAYRAGIRFAKEEAHACLGHDGWNDGSYAEIEWNSADNAECAEAERDFNRWLDLRQLI